MKLKSSLASEYMLLSILFSPLRISFSRSHHTIWCFSTGPTMGHLLILALLGKKACCSISTEQRLGWSSTTPQDAEAGGHWAGGSEQQPRGHPLREAAQDLGKVLLQLDIWDAVSPTLLVSNNLCFCSHCCKEGVLLYDCH